MITAAQADKIWNQSPDGTRIVTVCVPTRAVRILVLDGDKTFRCEQLDPQTFTWRPLSTHTGTDEWESFYPALEAACKAQVKLKELVKLAVQQNNMARIKALEGTTSLTPAEQIL